jgi:hypothetical protein
MSYQVRVATKFSLVQEKMPSETATVTRAQVDREQL